MLLVTLVVVGHGWTLLSSPLHTATYRYLYLWHVPAFVMVTGYLSRGFAYDRRQLRRLVTTVVVPYVVFEGLLALFRVWVGGENLERVWLNPHWPMWYLSVLFLWRLATPALRRIRFALPLSVGISLAGGLVDVEALDVNRALGLLPFFTLGLLATPEQLRTLRSDSARRAGRWVLAAGWAVVGLMALTGTATEWLYYRTPYADLGAGWLSGAALRLVLLCVGGAMALSALAWVPRRGGRLAALGAASLVVYLCHGFFVLAAEYAGVPTWAGGHPAVSFVVVTASAVGLALVLASRPVATRLQWLVTPVR